MIVNILEVVKFALLLQEVVTRWFGGLFFKGEMHPFVPPILLGVSGLDTLNINAQAEPPYRQSTQSE